MRPAALDCVVLLRFHLRPYTKQSRPDPGLRRPERDPFTLGDFDVRQTFHEGERESPALVVGQLGNRRMEPLPAHGSPDLVVDVVGRLEQLEVHFVGLAFRGGFVPHAVDRLVAGEAQEPRPERSSLRVEATGLPPDGHERVLDGFLGQTLRTGYAKRYGVHPATEPLIQRFDRQLVAASNPV